MVFPPQQLDLSISAISGICGSISIACWVVVFSPQIVENFRRGSADGLSLQFIIVWLLGDAFNILGAVMQGVLPTMVILALYYTIADIVLLAQCFYYRGFTWRDEPTPPKPSAAANLGDPDESTGLLSPAPERSRRWSGEHLSPVVPLHPRSNPKDPPPAVASQTPTTRLQATLFNVFAILMVCAAGILGWYVSNGSQGHPPRHHHHHADSVVEEPLTFSVGGQIFGYLCTLLYLSSRVPQILLNYRRKSTDGVSMLFFLFACIGNLTYVLSIFAYEPVCPHMYGKCRKGEAEKIYARYIAVNASWLIGSAGTLLLDLGIFAQFFWYRDSEGAGIEGMDGVEVIRGDGQRGGGVVDESEDEGERPLLG